MAVPAGPKTFPLTTARLIGVEAPWAFVNANARVRFSVFLNAHGACGGRAALGSGDACGAESPRARRPLLRGFGIVDASC